MICLFCFIFFLSLIIIGLDNTIRVIKKPVTSNSNLFISDFLGVRFAGCAKRTFPSSWEETSGQTTVQRYVIVKFCVQDSRSTNRHQSFQPMG